MQRRRALRFVWLAALLPVACAGDLVVRAPQEPAPRAGGALAAIAPLAVALPPAQPATSSADPVGERGGGLGLQSGSIYLTEDPGTVVWRLVAQELRAAGHRVVDAQSDVNLEIQVLEFRLRNRARSLGWEMSAAVRIALRVSQIPGAEAFSEFSYTSERSSRTLLRPGVRENEQLLAECLGDLAGLVSEREALAAALRRFAADAP